MMDCHCEKMRILREMPVLQRRHGEHACPGRDDEEHLLQERFQYLRQVPGPDYRQTGSSGSVPESGGKGQGHSGRIINHPCEWIERKQTGYS